MSFGALALISLIAIAGPLLATPPRWRLPVVLGELLGGVVFGSTGFRVLHPGNATFTFLADVGFALVMFVAGTHVPIRDPSMRSAIRPAIARAAAIGVVAIPLAVSLSHGFGTGHVALYAVLMASSSAALILPTVDSLQLRSSDVVAALPQVAVADAACIVALPLAIDPPHAGRAALGALAVAACSTVVFILLRWAERSGRRRRVHQVSEDHEFALELRISLVILFAVAAVATQTHVSIMLAGFGLGLAVTAVGEPRRLAKQLFAVTEGFLGPLFFVWLGASLDLRALGDRPSFILLGCLLGLGAVLAHLTMRITGQPAPVGALVSAQLGVPVAAATLGSQLHLLKSGEAPALILGALLTIGASIAGASLLARQPAAASTTAAAPG